MTRAPALPRPARLALLTLTVLCALLALPRLAGAATTAPWWRLDVTAAPTIVPAQGEVQLFASANNLGDASVQAGPEHPVTLTDTLPAGLTPTGTLEAYGNVHGCKIEGATVICTSIRPILPYEQLAVRIVAHATIAAPVPPTLPDTLSISGAGIAPSQIEKPLQIDTSGGLAQTPFGVETFALAPEGEAGEPFTQAGSHPFQLTTTLDLNQTLFDYNAPKERGFFPSAPALPQNLHFNLPPGLIGYPEAVPRCSEVDFSTLAELDTNLCPADTAIGVATVEANIPTPLGLSVYSVPVFNLEPASGEPARFGFDVKNVPVVLRTAIPTGGEYGVRVSVEYAPQTAQVLASQVTLWGVPHDPRHDSARGWECLDGGVLAGPNRSCEPHDEPAPKAFLTLPSSCGPLAPATVSGNSWPAGSEDPEKQIQPGPGTEARLPLMTGCGALQFDPSLDVQPDSTAASTPAGLDVTVTMPQAGLLAGEGTAEPALKDTTVTLPEGLQLNPSAANGLGVCSALAFGFEGFPETAQSENVAFTEDAAACPDSSKLGTAAIETPLLPGRQVTGSLYLAEQNVNPFNPPLALYLIAEEPLDGVRVKLAGTVTPQPSGQLVSSFQNTPQLPFSNLHLHFFTGARASLSTPPRCGSYQASSSFTGWSGQTVAPASEPAFQIASGPGGGPCPGATRPFNPSFTAAAQNPQAGALTPFTVTIGHSDSDQPLQRIVMHLPEGIAALISQVTPCPEAQVLADACGPESLVGHTTATAGLGSEPVTLAGQVFLTGALSATAGHPAAPFGLLAVTHAATGPFDLGDVPVLSTLQIDPQTAAVTVVSEPIPKLIKGVPAQLKQLVVTVERPGNAPFEFNPTNCNPMSITGTLSGYEGASAGVTNPFQVKNCGALPFKPTLSATVGGNSSKANGAGLVVKVASAGLGQANIAKVDLQLPKVLPARLTTIQKACVAAVFQANPAACPEGSLIGSATIHTPVLKSPVSGPAYLVSHGGAAFPDVEFVLQGEGVEILLDGQTDIKKGITYSRFDSAPDAPFTSFETDLPTGPHSALTANVAESKHFSLCGEKLQMPTVITAQNGAVIEQSTKIAVTGCAAVKGSKTKKLTLAQQLAKALKRCRSTYRHSAAKRAACERKSHATYTAKAMAACRRADRHSSEKRVACERAARKAYGAKRARKAAGR